MVLGKRNIRLLIMLAGLGLAVAFGAFFLLGTGPDCACPSETTVTKRKVWEPTPPRVERTLLTDEGERIAPSEIAPGRKVAIVVMKGVWCPVCRAEVARLKARAHEVWGAGGYVAVVTDHTPEQNANYADGSTAPFPVLSDLDYDQVAAWGLYRPGMRHPVPGVVFLDRDGKVVKVHRGRYPGREQDDMIIRTLHEM